MIGRFLLGLSTALALAACGGEGEAPPRTEDAAPASRPATAEPQLDPEPLDPDAVARAIAEDSALEAENRASYERRVRSMAGYEECMAQARDLPPDARARIEAACARLPETP